jgi:hypothetical protein
MPDILGPVHLSLLSSRQLLAIGDRWLQIGARYTIFQGMDETKIEKLARRSGRVNTSTFAIALSFAPVQTRVFAPVRRNRDCRHQSRDVDTRGFFVESSAPNDPARFRASVARRLEPGNALLAQRRVGVIFSTCP